MDEDNKTESQEPMKEETKKVFPLKYAVVGFILLMILLASGIAVYDVFKKQGDEKALKEATLKHIEVLNSKDSEAYWEMLTIASKSKLEKNQVEQFMSASKDRNMFYELESIDSIGVSTAKNEATITGLMHVSNNGILILELSKALNISLSNLAIKKADDGLIFSQDVVSDKGPRGQFIVRFAACQETSLLAQKLEGIEPASIQITFTTFQQGLIVTYKIPGNLVLTVFTPPASLDTPSFYMYLQKDEGRQTIIPKTKKAETLHVRSVSFIELWRKEDGVWKYIEKAAELPTITKTPTPPLI